MTNSCHNIKIYQKLHRKSIVFCLARDLKSYVWVCRILSILKKGVCNNIQVGSIHVIIRIHLLPQVLYVQIHETKQSRKSTCVCIRLQVQQSNLCTWDYVFYSVQDNIDYKIIKGRRRRVYQHQMYHIPTLISST